MRVSRGEQESDRAAGTRLRLLDVKRHDGASGRCRRKSPFA